MPLNELNEDNVVLFALKNHNNLEALTTEDLYTDMKLFRRLNSHIKKYLSVESIEKYNLCINTIVQINNIFGDGALILMLYYVDNQYYPFLKSFLTVLNLLPLELSEQLEIVPNIPSIIEKFKKI